jgi:hypothetical protein
MAKLSSDDESISAAVLWLLRGDAGQRALIAWHMGWEPAKEISGGDWLAPYLAETLTDSYSVVRYIGQRSLKRLEGFARFAYDYIGPLEARAQARLRVLEIWHSRALSPGRARASVLVDASGVMETNKMTALLRVRNNRRLELLE